MSVFSISWPRNPVHRSPSDLLGHPLPDLGQMWGGGGSMKREFSPLYYTPDLLRFSNWGLHSRIWECFFFFKSAHNGLALEINIYFILWSVNTVIFSITLCSICVCVVDVCISIILSPLSLNCIQFFLCSWLLLGIPLVFLIFLK